MNKAQNAQIQVNSHVVFTVYCHYLHDLGENSHITQHRQHDCTTVRFSQTVSVKPITIPFICLSSSGFFFFVVVCFVFFTLGVGRVKEEKFYYMGEKNQTQSNKTLLVCPRLNRVTRALIHSGQVNFTTEYW